MAVGLLLIALGLTSLVLSLVLSRRYVRALWGRVDQATMGMSSGNGVIPKWVSLVGLAGWAALVGGVIVAIARRNA